MTREALFINFTNEPFTGHWNGRSYTFNPGVKKKMNANIAAHFAKHLTNRELLKKGEKFEAYTSPKKPESVPEFMNLFNQAYHLMPQEVDEIGLTPDPVTGEREPSMNIHVQPRAAVDPYDANAQPAVGPGGKSTVIGAIDGDDESEFESGNTDDATSEGEGE